MWADISTTFCDLWLKKEILKWFPGNECKYDIHHHKASSQSTKRTSPYEKEVWYFGPELMYQTIRQDDPVKSHDLACLDFVGFKLLKEKVSCDKTLDGFCNLQILGWKEVTPERWQEVISSWKKRCRLVVKNKGYCIQRVSHKKNTAVGKILGCPKYVHHGCETLSVSAYTYPTGFRPVQNTRQTKIGWQQKQPYFNTHTVYPFSGLVNVSVSRFVHEISSFGGKPD